MPERNNTRLPVPPDKQDKTEQNAVRIVLFVLVLFASIVGVFVGAFAGWRAGCIALVLLMLPAVAIYRFSGGSP